MIVTSCGGHSSSTQSRKTPISFVATSQRQACGGRKGSLPESRVCTKRLSWSSMLALQAQSWSLKGLRSMRERGHPSSTHSHERRSCCTKPAPSLRREGGIAPRYICQHPLERDQCQAIEIEPKSAEKLSATSEKISFSTKRMVFCRYRFIRQ